MIGNAVLADRARRRELTEGELQDLLDAAVERSKAKLMKGGCCCSKKC